MGHRLFDWKWAEIVQDHVQWQALVSTVLNLQILYYQTVSMLA